MTNVLSTIGPVTEDVKNLRKIVKYSKFVRLNGAHNSLKWHKNICNRIKKINPSCKILIDLPGIKPRTLNQHKLQIKKNEKIIFYFKKKARNKNIRQVQLSKPLPKFKNPKIFSVSDGKFNFKFISKSKNYNIGKSSENFTLLSNKGLNIPFSIYDDNFQKIYLNFLKNKKFNFDAIGLSYVQNYSLVNILLNQSNKIIVSKIENDQGCKNMNSICQVSDIIMIDRGDLAAEIGDTNLYNQTIKISKCAKFYGKLLIMATENLETMIFNNVPTKSEIISLSFSKSLNADYLMLSDETATSKKFLQIINWLKNFNSAQENQKKSKQNKTFISTKDILFQNLSKISEKENKIILFTRKGYVIEKILSINPAIEVIIFTDNQKVYDLSFLRMNSLIFKTSKFPKSLDKFIYFNIKKNRKIIFKNDKSVCLLYAAFARKHSRANTLSVLEEKDFR